jgi:phenylacetate-CoA ligase
MSDEIDLFDQESVRAVQSLRVVETVSRLARRHPFYRESWRAQGIPIEGIESTDRLDLFPLTTKNQVELDPLSFFLENDSEDGSYGDLWDVVYTSGSSGHPVPIYQRSYDYFAILHTQRRMCEIRGITQDDIIYVAYPLTSYPHGALLRANNAAFVMHCSVANSFGGAKDPRLPILRTDDEIVQHLISKQPTVLWGVPSYLRQLLKGVQRSGGHLESLRLAAVSGEPCTEALRDDIVALAQSLNAKDDFWVSDSLGASELQCGLVQCSSTSGFHNPSPELFVIESVGEDGLRMADGEEGSFCVTHIDRRGTVLLRYVLSDKVVISNDACPECGCYGGRVVYHGGRSGSSTKIRGMLVELKLVESTVQRSPGVDDYRIAIRTVPSTGMDELFIEVLGERELSEGELEAIASSVRSVIGIRPRVALTTAQDLARRDDPDITRIKKARVVDERAR